MNPSSPTLHGPPCYTEQDLCNYAYHVWIQNGMQFDKNAWEEARACLDANLPKCAEPDSPRVKRVAQAPRVRIVLRPHQPKPSHSLDENASHSG